MPSATFPDTRWSLIVDRDSPPAVVQRAAEELCGLYWRPVYACIRGGGGGHIRSHEEAEDLTQGFFLTLLRREFFQNADPIRGRLRSYLLGALKNYLQTVARHEMAQKRGGGLRFRPVDPGVESTSAVSRLADGALTPDEQFDRHWAECLLEICLRTLREEFSAKGREAHYLVLRPLLAADGHDRSRLQEEAAARLGLNAGALRVAYHRFRERYQEILAAEVRATLQPGMEPGEELAYLAGLLRAGEK